MESPKDSQRQAFEEQKEKRLRAFTASPSTQYQNRLSSGSERLEKYRGRVKLIQVDTKKI